jgi:prepilin-type N-terminal cleavage/methylation domain-containing protein
MNRAGVGGATGPQAAKQEADMTQRRGFTLLELLMVVVIIGILAATAMPQFIKAKEKSEAAKALSYTGAIRSSEIRYAAQDADNNYTTDLDPSTTGLDITVQVPIGWRNPTAQVSPPLGGNPPTGYVTVDRDGGQFDGQSLGVRLGTGTVCGMFTVYDASLPGCVED